MRQVLLVIVLIAASFLGGAFINGPSLQWAQTKILRSLGLNNGGEITSVDLKAVVSSEIAAGESVPVKLEADANQGPRASLPSLLTEDESSKYDASNQPSTFQSRSKSASSGLIPPRSQPLPLKTSSKLAKSPGQESPPSDPSVKPVSAMTSLAPLTRGSSRSDSNIGPAILDSLVALSSANPPSSSSLSSTSPSPVLTSAPKPAAGGNDNWAVLERKMQSLGVSRYTMDGEPGGRIVFSCLIPVGGRQAVTQRFEAEGDDIIHAAQVALRRIVLWRASQPSSP